MIRPVRDSLSVMLIKGSEVQGPSLARQLLHSEHSAGCCTYPSSGSSWAPVMG